MAKITVIIPAYNAAATLVCAVRSVLAQTLRDIAVVIVDDGSKDATPEIADRLASDDDRVMVIHQANTGCYGARLAGMRQVQTEFFGFVDSDDYVAPTMFEKLVMFAINNDLDVAQCNWKGGLRNGGVSQIFGTREEILERIVAPRLIEGVDSMMVWDKIYRNQYDFNSWIEGDFATYEDLIHNMQLFLPVRRVGYLNEELYYYNVSASSSTRVFPVQRVVTMRNAVKAHNYLSEKYGLPENVVQELTAKWDVKNIKNAVVLTCTAKAQSWHMRVSNVRALIAIPELHDSLLRCSCQAGRFIRIVMALPIPLSVFVVRMMKMGHVIWKGIAMRKKEVLHASAEN